MRKSKKYLTKIEDVRIFNNQVARDIYNQSDFDLYMDRDGVYYLDEICHGAQIEYCASGTLEDIENYIVEVFGEEA